MSRRKPALVRFAPLIAGGAAIVTWTLFARYGFPTIFAQVYQEATPLHRYPLTRWLEQWESVQHRVTIVLAVLVAVVCLVREPSVRKWVDVRWPIRNPAGVPRDYWIANVAIFIVIFGQVFDTLIGREHWPFSHYPMYTGNQTREYKRVRVDGILDDGTEISLKEYLVPLSTGRISSVVSNYYNRDPEAHFQQCAEEYFHWYQSSRESGRHAGPEIVQIRIYELYWWLLPDASNVAEPKQTLLSEYPRRRI